MYLTPNMFPKNIELAGDVQPIKKDANDPTVT